MVVIKDNFTNTSILNFNYKYDLSNCLLETENDNVQQKEDFKLANKYDKDGYITELKRYDGSGSLKDNFIYTYYSGTNKLQRVYGSSPLYTYVANCNMLTDEVNRNRDIKYDHRNLITQLYHADRETVSRPYTYATRYYYDESGSRVRKLEYFNTQTNPPLITDWDNPGNGWTLFNNEFYVKGADGKDLATYQGSELEDWYVWGNDLAGKIRKDKPYYYYKDHLGSVRAVVNENAEIVAAYDYDTWGYPLEGREYNADSVKFKYTGKELDKESLYDYFGARYYDSRIGRWGQVEPLLDKFTSLSPYVFATDNPLIVIDPDGKDPYRKYLGSAMQVLSIVEKNIGKSYWEISNAFKESNVRYVYTEKGGFIDLRHFFAAAHISKTISFNDALVLGEAKEFAQEAMGSESADDPEDRPSNLEGANFGKEFSYKENVYENFKQYLVEENILDPSDPQIAPEKLYIPYDENDKPLPEHKSYYPYRGESSNYGTYYIP